MDYKTKIQTIVEAVQGLTPEQIQKAIELKLLDPIAIKGMTPTQINAAISMGKIGPYAPKKVTDSGLSTGEKVGLGGAGVLGLGGAAKAGLTYRNTLKNAALMNNELGGINQHNAMYRDIDTETASLKNAELQAKADLAAVNKENVYKQELAKRLKVPAGYEYHSATYPQLDWTDKRDATGGSFIFKNPDGTSPDHKVYLSRADQEAAMNNAVANSKARLELVDSEYKTRLDAINSRHAQLSTMKSPINEPLARMIDTQSLEARLAKERNRGIVNKAVNLFKKLKTKGLK